MAGSNGTFLLSLLKILPRRWISRVVGVIASIRWPRPMNRAILGWFARRYNVNLTEAERPIESYVSLNDFFTRALKPGVRPIATEAGHFVSPVDGVVSQFGLATNGRMIQAKGIDYSVDELFAGLPDAGRFREGAYAVIYLSPPDYHRIHSPCEGEVVHWLYSPGTLYPVNQAAVLGIPGLFACNERLTSLIQTRSHGMVAVVKVGATNVGKIRVVYDAFSTNRAFLSKARLQTLAVPFAVKAGAELGRFEMGSTVVLLFEAGRAGWLADLQMGQRVRMGQLLGRFVG